MLNTHVVRSQESLTKHPNFNVSDTLRWSVAHSLVNTDVGEGIVYATPHPLFYAARLKPETACGTQHYIPGRRECTCYTSMNQSKIEKLEKEDRTVAACAISCKTTADIMVFIYIYKEERERGCIETPVQEHRV